MAQVGATIRLYKVMYGMMTEVTPCYETKDIQLQCNDKKHDTGKFKI